MAPRCLKFLVEFVAFCLKVDARELFGDDFGTSTGFKLPAILGFERIKFSLREELFGFEDALLLEFLVHFGDDKRFKVEHAFNLPCGEFAERANARGDTLEEPDMRDG